MARGFFNSKGVVVMKERSIASIERVFGIPQKTLSRNGTAAGMALKKILRRFPWIVDVAECKFDEKEAKKIMIRNGVNELLERM